MKKTPLYDIHVKEGGKIVPFAGYLLPVQYPTSIRTEHEAVRTHCGLFDVSHMGEVRFSGPGALATINHLITNDYSKMKIGKCRYGIMCNEQGGCIDDLIVYKFADDDYFVVINADNHDKDIAHMQANLLPDTQFEDLSSSTAQLALQGPLAQTIIEKLTDPQTLPQGYYSFCPHVLVGGIDCLVSSTGYTGEKGFELYCANEHVTKLWQLFREAGKEEGLIPCGLGARNTLRLEAAMPLYGHEMDEQTTPLEAGLGFGVKLDKDEFIGHTALLSKGNPHVTRVGLVATGRGILREHQNLYIADKLIGHTTSGTFAPHLKQSIAMAKVDIAHAAVGTEAEADVRGRRLAVRIVELPFYKHD